MTNEPAVETKYVCGKCEAEDTDRGLSGPAPMFLNCWNCKAGYGMDAKEQMFKRVGMFPVR